jgi:hypothetical protein
MIYHSKKGQFVVSFHFVEFNLITLLGILTITIDRYYPKGNVRTRQKKPMRGTSLINFPKKISLPYKLYS